MTIDRAIKKLRKIKDSEGNIDFDVFLTEGDEVTLGFLNKNGDTKNDNNEETGQDTA